MVDLSQAKVYAVVEREDSTWEFILSKLVLGAIR